MKCSYFNLKKCDYCHESNTIYCCSFGRWSDYFKGIKSDVLERCIVDYMKILYNNIYMMKVIELEYPHLFKQLDKIKLLA